MNQSGQGFSGFRLLIDAILVLMILVIIIGIIGWIDGMKVAISQEKFEAGFDKAINAPTGQTIIEKNISFLGDSVFKTSAFAKAGVGPDCISFDALDIEAIEISSNKRFVEIKSALNLDVFYKCERQYDEECEMLCEISLGKDFE